jgi:hypothetical protein
MIVLLSSKKNKYNLDDIQLGSIIHSKGRI